MKKTLYRTAGKLLLAVFLTTVFTMWTYHGTTKNDLVWDTVNYLVYHVWWISNLSVDNIIWMFLSFEVSNWHPLTWISWAVDYQLYGGLVPWGYHLTNNILHTLNSLLVFVLTLVLFGLNSPEQKKYPFRTDSHALIAAFLTALLFAAHPQHVESVAWVAERKDLLCQLFLLLSMFTYVKYVTCHEDMKKRWFHGTLGLFVMALLSKPMAVTFPAVMLLIDVYPLRRSHLIQPINQFIKQQTLYCLAREKLPFFLLSLLLILLTLLAQERALSDIPIDLRVLNASNSIILYLSKLMLPLHFAAHYPYFVDVGERIIWKDFVPMLSVLGLSLASLFAWTRGYHAWLIAWLFYLVTLSPVLGLIQVGSQGAADRYAYFPTLPAYFLVGAGILAALNKPTRKRNLLILVAAIAVVFLLGSKTRQQIRVWENLETLWSHAVKNNLETVSSRHNLGIVHFHKYNYEKAIFNFDRSIKLQSAPRSTLAWRGMSYIYLDRYGNALKDFIELGKLTESKPELNFNQSCIYFNTGWLYAQSGMMEESVEFFGKVDQDSQLRPNADAWLNWLENINQAEDNSSAIEDLPGFCETPTSSRMLINDDSQTLVD